LCTSGSSRENWEQQEDQEADDIFGEHFEQRWRWMLYVMSWEWSLVIPSTVHWEANPSWGAERMLMRLSRAQNVHISVKVAVEKGREKKKIFWYPFVELKWIPYLSCSAFQSKATWKFGIKKSRTRSCSLDYWNTRTARGDTSHDRGGVLEILLAFKVQYSCHESFALHQFHRRFAVGRFEDTDCIFGITNWSHGNRSHLWEV
jgi:hypothetical protein